MRRIVIFFTLFVFFISSPVFGGNKRSGDGPGSGMAPYNIKTFTTIEGNIKSIDASFNPATSETGLHLTVKTPSGEYIVHVCPKWYADQKQIEFQKGESLTISGSTFTKDNQANIYAATIDYQSASSSTLQLRNPDTGDELWKERLKPTTDSGKQEKNRNKKRFTGRKH